MENNLGVPQKAKQLSYDPAIPLVGYTQNNWKLGFKQILVFKSVFIVVLFTVAKGDNIPSVQQQMKG